MKTPKSFFVTIALLLFFQHVFAVEVCRCRSQNGNTLTTYGYAVGDDQGCCTGTVDDFWGGQQNNYVMGNEGVWELQSSNTVSAASAQASCCPSNH